MMPGRAEHLAACALEQAVVDDQQDRGVRGEQPLHDHVGQDQAELVSRPAGLGEEPIRAAVMPHPCQARAGPHPGHGALARLGERPDDQGGERAERRGGEAGPHAVQQVGKRAG